ncbi:MAG TPA: LuxR C-terminal-related transcriptional regulator [Acidimicrobiales bacterium]|nr:LuxR C-terminal-related transcriptional regulator [Acidimicrobiales bacterium]
MTPQRGRGRPGRLPLSFDRFVAREAETAAVAALLRRCPLVTVGGGAGVGKTRLAIEVAGAVASDFPDGVAFVPLASIRRPGGVPQAVADALGLDRCLDATATVADHLRRARLLLVLDNCEHLGAEVAETAAALLAACPRLGILATSQVPLAAAGETVWRLGPLAVPAVGAGAADVEAAAAVRLFCDRAGAASGGFALTPEVAPAVTEICRRLDGVPLALELAAPWVRVLAPAEIAARLADRFALLTGGNRLAVPRHQSLRAALDWSYELCSAEEQAVLRRLAAFAGGAPLPAVGDVCSDRRMDAGTVTGALTALVARSLVTVDDRCGKPRYRMLETVRQYAAERLAEAGEGVTVRERHARWCLALAEASEPQLTGAEQRVWLARLGAEHENLRTALEWVIANGRDEIALRLAGALTLFWRMGGHFDEGRRYLDAALATAGAAPDEARAKAEWGLGLLSAMLGDHVGAAPVLHEALHRYRILGDAAGAARSLLVLGNCAISTSPVRAQALLEQSVALARDAGDEWCTAHALAMGGLSHVNQGAPQAARPLVDEAVAVARRSGDAQGLRIGLALLGRVARHQGAYAVAEAALAESRDLTRELGEHYGVAVATIELGAVALARGDREQTGRLLAEAEIAARSCGSPGLQTETLVLRGRLAQAEGDFERARRLFEEAVDARGEAGYRCAPLSRGLGEVAAACGDEAGAARLLEDAVALAREIRDPAEEAAATHGLAELARAQGDHALAEALHRSALRLRRDVGDGHGQIDSVEAIGSLAVSAGRRHAGGAQLLGAAERLRHDYGWARTAIQRRQYEDDVAALRERHGADAVDAMLARGAELTLAQAARAAARAGRKSTRPTTGAASLTATEQKVAALAAQGMSNVGIAAELFMSASTVKRHLRRIFAKLRVTSRVQLVQMPLDAGPRA